MRNGIGSGNDDIHTSVRNEKSGMHMNKNTAVHDNTVTVHLILKFELTKKWIGKLIFKNNVNNVFNNYSEMQKIVNHSISLKPSVYHDDSVDLFAKLERNLVGSVNELQRSDEKAPSNNYMIRSIESHPFSAKN